ncbi:PqqD family protein [Deinococcus yavapaiensis]|uniref:Coenzyme PQQ synthesis protein D (PqqD) n=1 Tax=Deinococcus yavapaiensis KR-236 TaxID=694435 RepID=A0A318SLU5_9DEIO|nr:PqqD family protein [Deinococcus yavapaiensis]PYE55653.1 coenzyme PQQ synthesis protein D (PqqD) [Deinococcus yavapaiensis KR-236]
MIYKPVEQVIVTDLEDELVLLDPSTQAMFSLNRVGRWLWQALPASRESLERQLADSFGIDATTASRDVGAVLSALLQAHLIEVHG